MKAFTVAKNDDGKKLIRVIRAHFTALRTGDLHRALRKRDIKVNGSRVRQDQSVFSGDQIEIFLPDTCFDHAKNQEAPFRILYEDDNLILVDKRPGMLVHPGPTDHAMSLVEHMKAARPTCDIHLCHRIDRNTGGLLLLAKNKVVLDRLLRLMTSHQIVRRYRCLVFGHPDAGEAVTCADGLVMQRIIAYHEKTKSGRIYVHDTPQAGDATMITRYRVRHLYDGKGPSNAPIAELDVELETGRTHQIRAHLSHIGHPLLGDAKYGVTADNRRLRTSDLRRVSYQQLCATALMFFDVKDEKLSYLLGKTFSIEPAYTVDLDKSLWLQSDAIDASSTARL